MKWVFSPDEFTYIWAVETGRDRRPYPVDMARRGTVRTESDWETLKLAERFPRNSNSELTGALTLCARGDVTTVTVSGDRYPIQSQAGAVPGNGATIRTQDGNDANPVHERSPILAFGAAHLVWGAVLVADDHEVSVISCHARRVAQHLVAAMGSVTAGRLPAMSEPREVVLGAGLERWQQDDSARGAEALRRTLCRPIDARGFITVTVNPEDPMSPPTRYRTWLDFTGDGRYLLTTSHDLTLAPVTDSDLVTQLGKLARIR